MSSIFPLFPEGRSKAFVKSGEEGGFSVFGDVEDLNADGRFETDRARERTDASGDFSFSILRKPASGCSAEVSRRREGGFEYMAEDVFTAEGPGRAAERVKRVGRLNARVRENYPRGAPRVLTRSRTMRPRRTYPRPPFF